MDENDEGKNNRSVSGKEAEKDKDKISNVETKRGEG